MGDGSVIFVEAAAGRVSSVDPSGAVTTVAETGGSPNGLAVGPDGALYVCNNGGFLFAEEAGRMRVVHGGLPASYTTGSIQRIDLAARTVETIYTHCGDVALCAPNDLVFDAHGGFYFSDFGKVRGRVRDIGSIYYAQIDGRSISEVVHPIANPNGVGLSPDGKTLYVSETETSRLWAFDIRGPGKLELQPSPSPNGGRLICGLPGYQRFDSLAVDAEGNICVATLVHGRITVIAPTGEIVDEVNFHDPATTNICFGGDGLRTAYVTLSSIGEIVEMAWPRPGLKLNYNA